MAARDRVSLRAVQANPGNFRACLRASAWDPRQPGSYGGHGFGLSTSCRSCSAPPEAASRDAAWLSPEAETGPLHMQKAIELGARVVAMCDSDGYVTDENGSTLKRSARSRRSAARASAEYAGGCRRKLCPRREHLDRPVRHRAALRDPERAGHRGAGTLIRNGVRLCGRGREHADHAGAHRDVRKAGVLLPRPRRPTPAASPSPAWR
jgi:hypothetical protein